MRAKPVLATLVAAFLLLESCVFSAPQVERLIQASVPQDPPGRDLEVLWTAEVNSQGRLVKLYSGGPHKFVFLSEENDLISFDGWVVRAVTGFGFESKIGIDDNDGTRTFSRDGVPLISVACRDWQLVSSTDTRWNQHCPGLPIDSVITLDKDGAVAAIRQLVSPEGHELLLKKL